MILSHSQRLPPTRPGPPALGLPPFLLPFEACSERETETYIEINLCMTWYIEVQFIQLF